jgi:hypothetical protein
MAEPAAAVAAPSSSSSSAAAAAAGGSARANKNVHIGAEVHLPADMWPNEKDPPDFYEGTVTKYKASFSGTGCTRHKHCPTAARNRGQRWDIETEDVDNSGKPIIYYLCWPAMQDMLVLQPGQDREHLAPDRRSRGGMGLTSPSAAGSASNAGEARIATGLKRPGETIVDEPSSALRRRASVSLSAGPAQPAVLTNQSPELKRKADSTKAVTARTRKKLSEHSQRERLSLDTSEDDLKKLCGKRCGGRCIAVFLSDPDRSKTLAAELRTAVDAAYDDSTITGGSTAVYRIIEA